MMLSDFKAGDWVFTATHIELEYIKEVNKKGWLSPHKMGTKR